MIVECMDCGSRVGYQDKAGKEFGLCEECFKFCVQELAEKLLLWERWSGWRNAVGVLKDSSQGPG